MVMASLTQLLADGGSSGHMDWGDGGWWMLMFWGPILFIGLTGLVAWFIRSTQGPGVEAGPEPIGTIRWTGPAGSSPSATHEASSIPMSIRNGSSDLVDAG